MAKYDQGGGCACGLSKVCDCKSNTQMDGTRARDEAGLPITGTNLKVAHKVFEIDPKTKMPIMKKPRYKYSEEEILADLKTYLDNTYGEHYATGDSDYDNDIQCFDAWIARGNSTDTFVNTAMKYLWRYGKKDGSNKKDLFKAFHYIFMAMHVDHYRKRKKDS